MKGKVLTEKKIEVAAMRSKVTKNPKPRKQKGKMEAKLLTEKEAEEEPSKKERDCRASEEAK
ncbi:hypothetical protein L484_008102 [Morus notabilis]|uniref:Uncharacterized protein n=1 Tax=Morus notabilis TaxID=981085 RepID=W9QFE6_9ROSA|nr:hypothetical protein L484_008102 [Morus notabilis]